MQAAPARTYSTPFVCTIKRPFSALRKPEDIEQYQRVLVALDETIRIMGEIDVVIEEHDGWPIQ